MSDLIKVRINGYEGYISNSTYKGIKEAEEGKSVVSVYQFNLLVDLKSKEDNSVRCSVINGEKSDIELV